jgi:hypothetical protein
VQNLSGENLVSSTVKEDKDKKVTPLQHEEVPGNPRQSCSSIMLRK